MKKPLLWLLIMLLSVSMIATFSITGCKKEAAPVKEEVVEEAPAEEVVEEAAPAETTEKDIWGTEPVTIRAWTWQTHPLWGQWHRWVETEYNKLHPNITVEVSEVEQTELAGKLKASIAADEMPDLSGVHPEFVQTFIDAGALLELTDIIKGDAEWSEWLGPCFGYEDLYYGPNKNQIYFMPNSVNMWALLYYKDKFPNGYPKTLEDFYRDAERLNKEGIIPMDSGAVGFPLALNSLFMVFYYQLDPEGTMIWDAASGKIPWDNDVFKKSLQAVKDLYDNGVLPEDLIGRTWWVAAWENFLNHGAASFWFGGSFVAYSLPMEDVENDNVGYENLPAIDANYDSSIWIGGTGNNEAVNPNGKNVEIALDVLKFMASPEAQKQMITLGADIPPNPGMFMDEDGNLTVKSGHSLLDSMILKQGMHAPKYAYVATPIIADEVGVQLTNIILGDTTIDDAIRAIQAKTDELLE